MEESIVKVCDLSHRYSVQWAVKDVNFEIRSKGILGLLGSNGAGKSTTMNIICGVLKPTRGEVFINGVNLRENPVEAKKNIGFLPQKAPLYPDFTVDEYLVYCAKLHLMEKENIRKAVDEAKDRCGIAHFSNRLIRNLSGGYQQRVGIAQAIVHNPKFVVLDEPTNGLDPNQIVEVRKLIQQIAEDRAVMLSTHILSEVQATCQDIKMIENGKMVFSGTLEEFDNYVKPNSVIVSLLNNVTNNDLMLDGIKDVENLGEHRFRLRYDGTEESVARIAETCVSKGWGLTELNIERSSLDTVFATLSKQARLD